MSEHNRRKFDSEDIEQMILETENPKDRAILMILLNMADRLVNHEKAEMDIIVEAKRLVLLGLFFTNVIIAMLTWYGSQIHGEFRGYQATTDRLVVEVEKHKEHHVQEERFSRERGVMVPQVK